MNTTFFQKPRKEWSNIEKKAFEEIQNICQRHDGDAEARYGAWDAMIWLSSQPEIQLTNDFKTQLISKLQQQILYYDNIRKDNTNISPSSILEYTSRIDELGKVINLINTLNIPISPFADDDNITLQEETITVNYRNTPVTVNHQFYHSEKTGHNFTTSELDDDFMWNVFRKYCEMKGMNSFSQLQFLENEEN